MLVSKTMDILRVFCPTIEMEVDMDFSLFDILERSPDKSDVLEKERIGNVYQSLRHISSCKKNSNYDH